MEAASKAAVDLVKTDKDIGGAHLEQSLKLAGQVIQKFGGQPLRDAIDAIQLADGSMLGDNIHFARLLVAVGKASSEDKLGTGTGGGNGATDKAKETAQLKGMYPNSPSLKF